MEVIKISESAPLLVDCVECVNVKISINGVERDVTVAAPVTDEKFKAAVIAYYQHHKDIFTVPAVATVPVTIPELDAL